jgi:hypothetical protein
MSIYCHTCHHQTKTVKPIMVRRFETKYHVFAICNECKGTKTGPINKPISELPVELQQLKQHWNYLKYYDYNGEKKNLFELLDPLINY